MKLDIKPIALDASISQLVLDIDGQVVKYSHGPQVSVPVQWPGPKGSSQVRLYATLAGGGNTPSQSFEGPWALFRLLDRAQLQPTSQPEKMIATFNLEGRRAQFEINSASAKSASVAGTGAVSLPGSAVAALWTPTQHRRLRIHRLYRGGSGKIPCLGDFASRRLPNEFINPWIDGFSPV